VPEGLCFLRIGSTLTSYYDARVSTVYLGAGSPVGGELAALAHEVCHAHQHRVIVNGGLTVTSNLDSWYQTAEGKDFVMVTGWRLVDGKWIENCERWSCGYPNPLEDAAEFCANWYGKLYGGGSDVQQYAPLRYAWAIRSFPAP